MFGVQTTELGCCHPSKSMSVLLIHRMPSIATLSRKPSIVQTSAWSNILSFIKARQLILTSQVELFLHQTNVCKKKSSMPCDSKLIKHRENVRNAHLLFSIFSFCSSILHLFFIFEVVLKPVQFFDLCSLKSATIFLRFFEMALLVSVTYEYKSYGYARQIHECAQSAL